MRQKVYLAK